MPQSSLPPHAAPPGAPADVHARLAALEARHRRLRYSVAGVALAGAAVLGGVAARPGAPAAAESRLVLTAPNGRTTATLELRDDGTLAVRIAGTLTRAAAPGGPPTPAEVPLWGEFVFVPGRRDRLDAWRSPADPEVRVLKDGRVLAYLGGPLARPLMP
jgi:hypothetical protein